MAMQAHHAAQEASCNKIHLRCVHLLMLILRIVFITDLFIAVTQSLVRRVSCEGKNLIAIPVAMHCSMVKGAQQPLPSR